MHADLDKVYTARTDVYGIEGWSKTKWSAFHRWSATDAAYNAIRAGTHEDFRAAFDAFYGAQQLTRNSK